MEARDLMAFSDLLVKYKDLSGKTFLELDTAAGYSTMAYREHGYVLPKEEKLPAIAQAYGIPLEEAQEAVEKVKRAKAQFKLARKAPISRGKSVSYRCYSRRGRISGRIVW